MKFIFLIIIYFTFSFELQTLPRFAIMRGSQCKDCHSNPTGGLIRNEDGFNWGKNNLKVYKTNVSSVSQKLNENINIGLDFRFQYLYSQALNKTDFHKMSSSVYTDFKFDEMFKLISRYDFYRGYFEGFGILNIFPFEGYLKIGTFSPNFGLRLDDHTSYTRKGDEGLLNPSIVSQGLIFEPGYTNTGIEVGAYYSDFLFITLSAGQDKYPFRSDPVYFGRIEFVNEIGYLNFLFGASYGVLRKFNLNPTVKGVFAGIGTKDFSILSEYDLAENYIEMQANSSALMIEGAVRLNKGLDFIVRYDQWIPNIKNKNSYFSHLNFGFEWFPISFVELRPQYRIYIERPKEEKNNSFILHFHFWF